TETGSDAPKAAMRRKVRNNLSRNRHVRPDGANKPTREELGQPRRHKESSRAATDGRISNAESGRASRMQRNEGRSDSGQRRGSPSRASSTERTDYGNRGPQRTGPGRTNLERSSTQRAKPGRSGLGRS